MDIYQIMVYVAVDLQDRIENKISDRYYLYLENELAIYLGSSFLKNRNVFPEMEDILRTI